MSDVQVQVRLRKEGERERLLASGTGLLAQRLHREDWEELRGEQGEREREGESTRESFFLQRSNK